MTTGSQSAKTKTEIRYFIEKIKQRTAALEQGDAETGNAIEKEIGVIYRDLRSRGRAEQEALFPLLDDADPNVRETAATYVLDFEPARALPVLESLANIPKGRFARSRASLTLNVWRSGDYRIA